MVQIFCFKKVKSKDTNQMKSPMRSLYASALSTTNFVLNNNANSVLMN